MKYPGYCHTGVLNDEWKKGAWRNDGWTQLTPRMIYTNKARKTFGIASSCHAWYYYLTVQNRRRCEYTRRYFMQMLVSIYKCDQKAHNNGGSQKSKRRWMMISKLWRKTDRRKTEIGSANSAFHSTSEDEGACCHANDQKSDCGYILINKMNHQQIQGERHARHTVDN